MNLKRDISLAILRSGRLRVLVVATLLAAPFAGKGQLTVYPGDANNNGLCSHVDVLYLGLAHGSTGPARDSSNIVWMPHPLQTNWNQSTIDGVNYGYIDCDGNGTIDSFDLAAIDQNFGFTVTPSGPVDTSVSVGGNAPVLSVSLPTDTMPVQGVVTFTADINLGTFLMPANGIYGVALTIAYDPAIVDMVTPNPHGGWLTNNSFGLNRAWVDSLNGLIYMVITNTDQLNRSGAGAIGSIGIVMDDNIRMHSSFNLGLEIVLVHGLSSSGTTFPLMSQGDQMAIITASGGEMPDLHIDVAPNPVKDIVRVSVPNVTASALALYDMSGRKVGNFPAGILNRRAIDMSPLPPGIYFLELTTKQGIYRKKLLRVP